MTPFPIWLLTLTVLGALSSVFTSCTVPLVGFAAVAATTLSRRQGVMSLAMIWLVNQALGFSVRSYPLEASTLAWGVVMLAAALGALALGRRANQNDHRLPRGLAGLGSRVGVSLLAGFLLYELILWQASFLLGTSGGFTPAVLGSVLLRNSLWALGLTVLYRQGERLKLLERPRFPSTPSFPR